MTGFINNEAPFTSTPKKTRTLKDDDDDDTSEIRFELYDDHDVENFMSEAMILVKTALNIPSTTARILMDHFRWKSDDVFAQFFKTKSCTKFFVEAGIFNPFQKIEETNGEELIERCENCYTICGELVSLECNHLYCIKCLNKHIVKNIAGPLPCSSIPCLNQRCLHIIKEKNCVNYITDRRLRRMFIRLFSSAFVESNPLMRWCSNEFCSNLIKLKNEKVHRVICSCGNDFCFDCGESWHSPLSCDLTKEWNQNFDRTSNNVKWMELFEAQLCPNCKHPEQKQGIMLRTVCGNCSHQFCWFCLNRTTNHMLCSQAYFTRNPEGSTKPYKRNFFRFKMYCERFMTHHKVLQMKDVIIAKVSQNIEGFLKLNADIIRAQLEFVRKAVLVYLESHRFLMFTYAFGYFIQTNEESDVLESSQDYLEFCLERLGAYLEIELSVSNMSNMRTGMVTYSSYCKQQSKMIETHIAEGQDGGLWKYCESLFHS